MVPRSQNKTWYRLLVYAVRTCVSIIFDSEQVQYI